MSGDVYCGGGGCQGRVSGDGAVEGGGCQGTGAAEGEGVRGRVLRRVSGDRYCGGGGSQGTGTTARYRGGFKA